MSEKDFLEFNQEYDEAKSWLEKSFKEDSNGMTIYSSINLSKFIIRQLAYIVARINILEKHITTLFDKVQNGTNHGSYRQKDQDFD